MASPAALGKSKAKTQPIPQGLTFKEPNIKVTLDQAKTNVRAISAIMDNDHWRLLVNTVGDVGAIVVDMAVVGQLNISWNAYDPSKKNAHTCPLVLNPAKATTVGDVINCIITKNKRHQYIYKSTDKGMKGCRYWTIANVYDLAEDGILKPESNEDLQTFLHDLATQKVISMPTEEGYLFA